MAVIAGEQKQGRGRMERGWYSPKGKGLYLSVLLRPQQPDISLLTLAMGLAVSETLRQVFKVRVCLKWPNDLLWNGKKLGGILCESSFAGDLPAYVVLGIGLNMKQKEGDFPEDLRPTATSLSLIMQDAPDQETLLFGLWKRLNKWYDLFVDNKRETIRSAFMKHSCYAPGQRLAVETGEGIVSGHFKGISAEGGLVLETRGGEVSYFAADIRSLQEETEDGHAFSR